MKRCCEVPPPPQREEFDAFSLTSERSFHIDSGRDILTFSGRIDMRFVGQHLKLDQLDRALLRDVDRSKPMTAADFLLCLEILFRRWAEQFPKPPAQTVQTPAALPCAAAAGRRDGPGPADSP